VSWSRTPVAQALVAMVSAATANGVYVHETPPEIVNPLCVVVLRPVAVTYSGAAFAVDDVELPVAIVGGLVADDAIDDLKTTVRQTVEGDPTLKGVVAQAWPTGERNWRNITGAGGIQLLYVELVLQIQM